MICSLKFLKFKQIRFYIEVYNNKFKKLKSSIVKISKLHKAGCCILA